MILPRAGHCSCTMIEGLGYSKYRHSVHNSSLTEPIDVECLLMLQPVFIRVQLCHFVTNSPVLYCREPPPMGLRGYGGMRTGGGKRRAPGPQKVSGGSLHVFPFLNMLNQYGANISLTEPYWWAATIYI